MKISQNKRANKRMPLTRTRIRDIAARHLRRMLKKQIDGIRIVDIGRTTPPNIDVLYGVDLKECWGVYLQEDVKAKSAFGTQRLLLISKKTRKIVYDSEAECKCDTILREEPDSFTRK